MNAIRIAARRLLRPVLVAALLLCAMPLMAQVNTWSWEPATGYPGKWNEAGVVWNPPACCPNSYPNSATADARMNKYPSGYVGAADLDGGSYTVNRLRFTNIASGNFVLTGNGGTLMLRGTTPYIQTGTQGGYLARIVGTHLNLADHTRERGCDHRTCQHRRRKRCQQGADGQSDDEVPQGGLDRPEEFGFGNDGRE